MFLFRKKKAKHIILGEKGEKIAVKLLKKLGFKILCKNYKAGKKEIDIIALDGLVLCFVEVKTREENPFSRPADAIGDDKRNNLNIAAKHYLYKIDKPTVRYRFDAIEVICEKSKLKELKYYPNAFMPRSY
ncbi:MAG: YraN family protein [Verrucomicrobiota bacterium]|nr:YraN family protein [Verrucomicrobiota bacterium]